MIKFINFLFLLLLLNACNSTGNDSGSAASSSSSTPPSNQTPPPPPADRTKVIEKATATQENADKLVTEVGTLKSDPKITPDKKTQLETLENTLNTTKTELATKKADPKATTSEIETLEKRLSTQTKELETKAKSIALDANIISDEQKKAKDQANLIANNAKAPLEEVKDILNKGGSLSDTTDLNNKERALGQALFDYEQLPIITASKDEIDAARSEIVDALTALNSAKTGFYAAENAEQEKLLAFTVKLAKNLLPSITDNAKKQELQKIIDESNDMNSEKDPSVKMQKLNNLNNKIKTQMDEMQKELLKLQKDDEAAKKKTAEPKKDFPYTLLTLEGDASELEESVKKIYTIYPKQAINDLNLLSNITGDKILIQNLKGNSTVKNPSFVTYDFNTKNSANLLDTNTVLISEPDLLKEFSLPQEDLTKYNNSTKLVDKIKEVSSLKSVIPNNYISVIGKIDEKLFITYQQGGNNKFLIKCNLNDPKNEIEDCNKPVLLGEAYKNTNVKIAVAYDKKSALVYNAEKDIYFTNDNFIDITSNNQVASKENPLAVKSVDGLDAGHICANVFNNNSPIKAATKIANIWYVLANTKVTQGTSKDGVDKICKIKEETILP